MAQQIFEPGTTAWEIFSTPHRRDHVFENKNSWQKYTEEKKKNDPTE